MEFLTILLSTLIGILSPAGLVVDNVAEAAIRDQLDSVETLEVRIDNTPSYEFLQGRVDRIRIAGRGIFPREGVRIDTLDVETDAIAVNPKRLRVGEPELQQPLQAGIRLVLHRDDLNRAFQAPDISEFLQNLSSNFASTQGEQPEEYSLIAPQIQFLDNNRLRFDVTLRGQRTNQQLAIVVESGLQLLSGSQLQLVEPRVIVNDEAVSDRLIQPLTEGINRLLDLSRLEQSGITVRLLQLEIEPDRLAIAAFVRLEPEVINSVN
jgi:hypothetical protein